MNSLPLICFFQGDFLLSYNYRKINCDPSSLQEIFHQHHNDLLIYRLNFEWGQNEEKYSQQEVIHSQAPVDLFIVEKWEVLSPNKLNSWLEQFARIRPFKLEQPFSPLITPEDYAKQLTRVKEGIDGGEFYQLNLSLPFKTHTICSPLEAFAHYHSRMPGDFHAFLPCSEGSLICLSPELFLKKDHTHYITAPIKGTAANNPDAIEELLCSIKENAELSMIVDLLRNDLNLYADITSSKVTSHRKLMNLGHLVHTCSTVEADSTSELMQLLPAMLPGGSISGCPKKRAVEEIFAVETYRRGFYCGITGWAQGEQAESAISIRSFWQNNTGDLFYHAGGGIVADSQIDHEYQEILLKARRINP